MANNKKNRSKKTKPSKAQSKAAEAIRALEAAKAKTLQGRTLAEIMERRDNLTEIVSGVDSLGLANIKTQVIQENKAKHADTTIDSGDFIENCPIIKSVTNVLTSTEKVKKEIETLELIIWFVMQYDFNIAFWTNKLNDDDDASGGPTNGGGTGVAV